MNTLLLIASLILLSITVTFSFSFHHQSSIFQNKLTVKGKSSRLYHNEQTGSAMPTIPIKSPFDKPAATNSNTDISKTNSNDFDDDDDDELPLTRENVELVLDEMRPYLQSDGGDVKLSEIDGPIVKLELVGACGTCPSSSMTMKMGLERRLKERIPEIAEVIQSLPDAPVLNSEAIETVLDGVRPFLAVAGGKISVTSITGVGGLQPLVKLKMEGSAASLQSVKIEIMQRIQRHFMLSLRIEWD